ncbi:MAG TPA: DUF3566 domain-containing protein [Acidimicrobiales bacterium]
MTIEQPLTGERGSDEHGVSPAGAVGALLGLEPGNVGSPDRPTADTSTTGPDRPTANPPPPGRRAERRSVEARQVTRVIRRIEPWSVARVAFAFSLSLWIIVVVASILIWWVASAAGAVGHLESFMAQLLADQSFTIDGGQLLRAAAISGVVLVVAGTGFTVLLALLFNLISELTGGLRLQVIEVETARRPTS